MDELKESGSESRRGGLRWHALAALWIAAVLIIAWGRHRSVDELWTAATQGSPSERVEAAQALAMRADPQRLAEIYPDTLLESGDPRLRELAFSNLFTRNSATALTTRDLSRLSDPEERKRAKLILRCRTTTPGRVQREDLDEWFSTVVEGGRR